MKIIENTCQVFTEKLASKAPTPGGGGASALVGAVGVALGNMVGSLTTGKKKYAHVEEDIKELNEKAKVLREKLLELVDKDALVFAPLAKAYGLPAETEEEKSHKDQVMEECLREACSVPLEIMDICVEAIKLQKEFAEKGSKLVLSDAGVGVVFCKAALEGASVNVFINTGSMKDRDYATKVEEKVKATVYENVKLADEIFNYVKERL